MKLFDSQSAFAFCTTAFIYKWDARIARISGLGPINLGNRIIEARGVVRHPLDLFSLGRSHRVSHWEPVVRVIQFLSSSPLLCLISLYGVVRQDSSPKFTSRMQTGFMCISMLNTPRTFIPSTATVVTYDVVQLFLPPSPNVLSCCVRRSLWTVRILVWSHSHTHRVTISAWQKLPIQYV